MFIRIVLVHAAYVHAAGMWCFILQLQQEPIVGALVDHECHLDRDVYIHIQERLRGRWDKDLVICQTCGLIGPGCGGR